MPPNILFIFTDQWRGDCLSCLGHPEVRTPHIDALADDGVAFRDVTTQAPVCVPARCSFFTGRYVHQLGHAEGMGRNAVGLWPETPNCVRAIRDAGYHTAVRGKLHLFWRHDNELLLSGPLLREFGFEDGEETTGKCQYGRLRASAYTEHLRAKGLLEAYWREQQQLAHETRFSVTYGASQLNEYDQMDGWVMNRGLTFLREHAADTRPWFLWLGPEGPHDPFDPPGEWADLYDPEKLDPGIRRFSEDPFHREAAEKMAVHEAPDAEIRRMRALYYGNISFLDHKIGECVKLLKEQGRYDNTWIVVSSDHGEMLGDFHLTAKRVFHRQAERVPLVIKPPASVAGAPRGHISDALVELNDVATTMRDIAGGELPHDQGKSLLPILRGEADPDAHRETVHSQYTDANGMIRTATRKMVFNNPDDPSPRAYYHLDEDPDELRNRVGENPAEEQAFLEKHVLPFYREGLEPDPSLCWPEVRPWLTWGRHPIKEILDRELERGTGE